MQGKSTREKIIDSTQIVIQEKGFANATTKEIARVAGVAEGSLYKNFDDKFDVLVATMLEGHRSLASQLEPICTELLASTSSLEKKIAIIAKMALAYFRQIAPIISSVMAQPETIKQYRSKASKQRRGPTRAVEVLASYLEREREATMPASLSASMEKGSERKQAARGSEAKVNDASDVDTAMLGATLLGSCYFQAWTNSLTGENLLDLSETKFCNRLARSITTTLLRT